TALMSLLTFHLHLFCDFLGSRGPDPIDLWPIPYLSPISQKLTFYNPHQWPLNAWPNVLLTIVLMVYIFWTAHKRGYSPISLISKRADAAFVNALHQRFGKPEKA